MLATGGIALVAGQAQAALKEYEASMTRTPNRLRGSYGAAMAAKVRISAIVTGRFG